MDELEENAKLGKLVISPTKPGPGWVRSTPALRATIDRVSKNLQENDQQITDLQQQVQYYLAKISNENL